VTNLSPLDNKQARSTTLAAGLILWLGLALAALLYSFAWSGSFHFDDLANFTGLESVFSQDGFNEDRAERFIFSGHAGPLGRPISLASFLIDGAAWPSAPAAMLYTNSLIHLLNGALLCSVLLALGRLLQWPPRQAALIAAVSSTLWLLMPLLASSSLMVVQRMTLLSSTFMLLGLWIYLYARGLVDQSPRIAASLMVFGLVSGTLLGIFSKEQAALLPMLVLVIEFTLLPAPAWSARTWHILWRTFFITALLLPSLLIAAYLVRSVLMADASYAIRDFTLSDRIWTEAVILWDYLRLAFLPQARLLGPFHDDYPIFNLQALSIVAAAAWGIVIIAAVWLRKRAPLFSFAVFWFLATHLLESTVIPLELYFEHRNYLAIVGPVFALVASAFLFGQKQNRLPLVGVLLGFYASMMAVVLFQTTSLFGNPALAGKLWSEQHPHSQRAAHYIALQYWNANNIPATIAAFDQAAAHNTNTVNLDLQALQLVCAIDSESLQAKQKRLDRILLGLKQIGSQNLLTLTLNNYIIMLDTGGCGGLLTPEVIKKIVDTALTSKNFIHDPQNVNNVYAMLALMSIRQDNIPLALEYINKALDALADRATLQLAMDTFNSNGMYQEGLDLLESRQISPPNSPWLRENAIADMAALKSEQRRLLKSSALKTGSTGASYAQ